MVRKPTKPTARAPVAPKKRGRGRPAVITAEVVERVAALMADGTPEEFACAACGVNPETFGPAVSRNEVFKTIKRKHDATFIIESLGIIKQGGEKISLVTGQDKDGNDIVQEKIMPWTGRAWILERRYKPHFNRTEVHKDHEGRGESGGLLTEADMLELERAVKQKLREEEANRRDAEAQS